MKPRIQEYLREDIGSGDITSELVVPSQARARGTIVCKEDCVLAGIEEAAAVFEELGAKVARRRPDGSKTRKGTAVLEVEGRARALLAGERTALNIVMRMSGIATQTSKLVSECRKINPKVRIAATRKTTPGFRSFEKRAVELGGGDPHRMGLYDAVLIKNNHITIAGGVEEALKRAKHGSFTKKVEIEVENERQALAALSNGADIIMLDNFAPNDALRLSKRLKRARKGIMIEISGGITPNNITKYAAAADIISLGSLTHSVKSIDFSMRIDRA